MLFDSVKLSVFLFDAVMSDLSVRAERTRLLQLLKRACTVKGDVTLDFKTVRFITDFLGSRNDKMNDAAKLAFHISLEAIQNLVGNIEPDDSDQKVERDMLPPLSQLNFSDEYEGDGDESVVAPDASKLKKSQGRRKAKKSGTSDDGSHAAKHSAVID